MFFAIIRLVLQCLFSFLLYHTKENKGTKMDNAVFAEVEKLYHTKENKGTKIENLDCNRFLGLYHTKENKGTKITCRTLPI